MEREEILRKIRQIIGNKKFEYGSDYLEKYRPTVGEGQSYSLTKKYLYIYCWVSYKWVDEGEEKQYRALIKRIPICYAKGSGFLAKKVALDDLCKEDLAKILDDITYFFWWESEVHYPQVKAKYDEILEYREKFAKMVKILET